MDISIDNYTDAKFDMSAVAVWAWGVVEAVGDQA